MACYKPLIRFYAPDNPDISGRVYTFARFRSERAKNQKLTYEDLIYRKDVMLIPCGQCIGCKIQHRTDWATRIEMEAKTWPKESVWFLTLTYDDQYIPAMCHDTGEIIRGMPYIKSEGGMKYVQTLWYEDIQLFLKRLRKTQNGQLRYFVAGEYGSKTARPHYHMILFGYYPEKIKPFHKTVNDGYFQDTRIEKLWKYGMHNMANPETKAYTYVAGYVTKKMDGENNNYNKLGMIPPFCQMSRMPGLGEKYYKENQEEIWKRGYIQLGSGKRAQIPRYFQKQREIENPRAIWEWKRERQQKAINGTKEQMGSTDILFEQYMKNKEAVIKKKWRKGSSKI